MKYLILALMLFSGCITSESAGKLGYMVDQYNWRQEEQRRQYEYERIANLQAQQGNRPQRVIIENSQPYPRWTPSVNINKESR